jgi:general secretion pathway protein E
MIQDMKNNKGIDKSSKDSINKKNLGDILVQLGSITEAQLQEVLAQQKDDPGRRKLGQLLIEKEYLKEEDMLRALAIQLDLPYYEKFPVDEIDPSLVKDIPIQFCRDNYILPIARDDFNVTVAVADPLNIFPMDDLRLILSTNVNMVVSSPNFINNGINRVYERAQDASQKVIDELNVPDDTIEDLEEARDLLEASSDDKPIIRLVNTLLSRAVKERATDIHIEPYESEVLVRFRIDGSLYETMQVPKRHMGSISSRIKIIGKLNIAEKRIPQDGRISIKVAGKDIDVRLSILPTSHGERIVMRLLDKSSGVRSLDEMGMDDWVYKSWSALVQQKHGIVLVTGPTGSGKTSLLYSSVVHINVPDINIMTIEDPVEYTLSGVGQIDVKSKIGMTFGAGLRSILRQDPDVIMIGEIRDHETASIAVQSSLTGHLVFSTLHTNDAASTITRLDDLEVQPFQIASAVLGVMATRLIRKLCDNCKKVYSITKEEMSLLEISKEQLANKTIYTYGEGCENCLQQGYSGRVPVHELLVMNDDIRNLLMKTQDSTAIRKLAVELGMKTLRQSAINKVLQGITSIEEAIAKTQSEELEVN